MGVKKLLSGAARLGSRIVRQLFLFLYPFPNIVLVFSRHAYRRYVERLGAPPSRRAFTGATVEVYEDGATHDLLIPIRGAILLGTIESARRNRNFVVKTVLLPTFLSTGRKGPVKRTGFVRIASVKLPKR